MGNSLTLIPPYLWCCQVRKRSRLHSIHSSLARCNDRQPHLNQSTLKVLFECQSSAFFQQRSWNSLYWVLSSRLRRGPTPTGKTALRLIVSPGLHLQRQSVLLFTSSQLPPSATSVVPQKGRKISCYVPRLEGFKEGFLSPHWFSFSCTGLGTHSVTTFPFPQQPAHDFVICFLLGVTAVFLQQHGMLALLFMISAYLWNCDVIFKRLFKD